MGSELDRGWLQLSQLTTVEQQPRARAAR